ncbi:MAG: decaprenyl-phosphate phosphoribosyltransferase [Planctomycetes bacterium]|nr:decaprenyl-phosphate phosphoribosyltransferase [Planctomycetota bacterium]
MPTLLKALRPHQWTKNLAVFVGILFARRLSDAAVMVPVAMLFLAFCLAASCIYLLNDIADRDEDRKHPVKCQRPIASGALSVGAARAAAAVIAISALLLVWFLPTKVRLADGALRPGPVVLAAYLTLNVGYTAWLKRVAIADVTCVALGFLIRVVGGPLVAEDPRHPGHSLEVSSWLILCTFFGALFLALAKRRGELLVTKDAGGGRSVLDQYAPQALDALLAMAGAATLLCYSIYTVAAETVAKLGSDRLLYTVPFVFFGMGRYLLLLYRRQRGEDPAAVLFGDRGMLLAIGGWIAMSALILALAR